MSDRENLERAQDLLERAADRADGEASERLTEFATRVGRWAGGDIDPDHGAMAQVLLKLDGIADDLGGEGAETIQAARSAITEYRKTVEGV